MGWCFTDVSAVLGSGFGRARHGLGHRRLRQRRRPGLLFFQYGECHGPAGESGRRQLHQQHGLRSVWVMIPVRRSAGARHFLDFDNDGWLDLFLASTRSGAGIPSCREGQLDDPDKRYFMAWPRNTVRWACTSSIRICSINNQGDGSFAAVNQGLFTQDAHPTMGFSTCRLRPRRPHRFCADLLECRSPIVPE